MSLQFDIYFKVISNNHKGYCSDAECEEEEREDLSYNEIVQLPIEFFLSEENGLSLRDKLEFFDANNVKQLVVGNVYEDGEIFNMLSEEFNYSEDNGGGSGYCSNSSKYEKHSNNYILKKAIFLGFRG